MANRIRKKYDQRSAQRRSRLMLPYLRPEIVVAVVEAIAALAIRPHSPAW